jgi:hypothetical protein
MHRRLLYDATRWPLPRSPAEERALGAPLTEYLWRCSDRPKPVFERRSGLARSERSQGRAPRARRTTLQTRSVRLGVEVEDDEAAAQVGEVDRVAVLVGELEVWCGLAKFDHPLNLRS